MDIKKIKIQDISKLKDAFIMVTDVGTYTRLYRNRWYTTTGEEMECVTNVHDILDLECMFIAEFYKRKKAMMKLNGPG